MLDLRQQPHTDLAFSDDVAARFLAYGWNVQRVGDANDRERLAQAFDIFKRTDDVPTLIIVESHIGYGAPHKHDTSAAHGEPLGDEEIRLAKRSYGWPEDAKFLVPDGVREHFQDGIGRRGRSLEEDWNALFNSYRKKYPDLADRIERMQRRELPNDQQGADGKNGRHRSPQTRTAGLNSIFNPGHGHLHRSPISIYGPPRAKHWSLQ